MCTLEFLCLLLEVSQAVEAFLFSRVGIPCSFSPSLVAFFTGAFFEKKWKVDMIASFPEEDLNRSEKKNITIADHAKTSRQRCGEKG